MTPFTLPISCPDCAGPLSLLNTRASGTVSLAILSCEPCQWEYEVSMTISRHTRADSWHQAQASAKLARNYRDRAREKELALAP